jgi:hypothetical protein
MLSGRDLKYFNAICVTATATAVVLTVMWLAGAIIDLNDYLSNGGIDSYYSDIFARIRFCLFCEWLTLALWISILVMSAMELANNKNLKYVAQPQAAAAVMYPVVYQAGSVPVAMV